MDREGFEARSHGNLMADYGARCNRPVSGARVGFLVNLHQSGGIDGGVGLCGGKGCMAKQLLDGTQVSTGRQKVRGEAVAQGVGRGGGRQAEAEAGTLHRALTWEK